MKLRYCALAAAVALVAAGCGKKEEAAKPAAANAQYRSFMSRSCCVFRTSPRQSDVDSGPGEVPGRTTTNHQPRRMMKASRPIDSTKLIHTLGSCASENQTIKFLLRPTKARFR